MKIKTFIRNLPLIALATIALTTNVSAATYNVTNGAFNGTQYAATKALQERQCGGLTSNKLTGLMLSIPVHEIAGGATGTSVSPMVLSRWDGWSLRTANRNLYSHVEYGSYKRAHWNPGIGLWQLDTWSNTLHLNHAQRIDTYTGGLPVARYLRDAYCNGTESIKSALYNTWYACRPSKCWNTYNDMYSPNSDSLSIYKTAGNQWDGGVTSHSCRWGYSASTFRCNWVNTNIAEGWMDKSDPTGQNARTPLAVGFLSFSTTNNKFASWLRSAGLGKEIAKWVPKSNGARNVNGWYDGTALQVYKCTQGSCYWSDWGLNL